MSDENEWCKVDNCAICNELPAVIIARMTKYDNEWYLFCENCYKKIMKLSQKPIKAITGANDE